MSKRGFAAALITALAIVLSPVAASPAAAVNAYEWNTTTNATFGICWVQITGACVDFEPQGDHLYVKDTRGDGHSAAIEWRNYYPDDNTLYRHGTCAETRGNGSSGTCNKDFREGSLIKIRACTIDWDTKSEYQCSKSWSPLTA